MDYDAAVAAFFGPREGAPVSSVMAAPTPARRLRDAVEPIAMHDVWSRHVNEQMAGHGLDFLSSYVGGRASVLGEPRPEVVAAAFAWFEPALVAACYDAARAALPVGQLPALRDTAVAESLREVLGDAEEVAAAADRLAEAAAGLSTAGRPLYAGLLAKGRPADDWQRLWWACDLAREHRGDSHVMAAGGAGLGPVEMNVLTELWLGMPLGSYTATRGWPPERVAAASDRLREEGLLASDDLTDSGRALRELVEAPTCRSSRWSRHWDPTSTRSAAGCRPGRSAASTPPRSPPTR